MGCPSQNSNDFLTIVTRNSQKSSDFEITDERSSGCSFELKAFSKRSKYLISNQTPSLNVLGSYNMKLKNNLFSSIDKAITSTVAVQAKFSSEQKTTDMATSPIKMFCLSPNGSVVPIDASKDEFKALEADSTQNSSASDVQAASLTKKNNDTHILEELWDSVENIELSYSEIINSNENSLANSAKNEPKLNSSNGTSLSINSNATNLTGYVSSNDDTDNDDLELDAEYLKLIDKKIKKMIKKSFEKSKRLSMSQFNFEEMKKISSSSTQNKKKDSPLIKL